MNKKYIALLFSLMAAIAPSATLAKSKKNKNKTAQKNNRKKWIIGTVVVIGSVAALGFGFWKYNDNKKKKENRDAPLIPYDEQPLIQTISKQDLIENTPFIEQNGRGRDKINTNEPTEEDDGDGTENEEEDNNIDNVMDEEINDNNNERQDIDGGEINVGVAGAGENNNNDNELNQNERP